MGRVPPSLIQLLISVRINQKPSTAFEDAALPEATQNRESPCCEKLRVAVRHRAFVSDIVDQLSPSGTRTAQQQIDESYYRRSRPRPVRPQAPESGKPTPLKGNVDVSLQAKRHSRNNLTAEAPSPRGRLRKRSTVYSKSRNNRTLRLRWPSIKTGTRSKVTTSISGEPWRRQLILQASRQSCLR